MDRLGRVIAACKKGPVILTFEPEKPVKSYWHPVIGDKIIRLFQQQAEWMLKELEEFQHTSYLIKVEDGTYAGSYRRVVESRNPSWRQGDTALSKDRAKAALTRIIEGRDNGSKADASLRSDIYYMLVGGREGEETGGFFDPPILLVQIVFGHKGDRFEEPEPEIDLWDVPFTNQF